MKVFTYDCVTLADVCEQNTLDYGHVIEEISIDFGGLDDSVLISLGS